MSATGRRGGLNPLLAGFIAGAVAAIVLGVLVKINLDYSAPWSATHTVTALVSDVDGISVGSDVRIAGRAVGQITSVTADGNHSAVTFHVDDADWPLAGDTSASIRLATLLGQKYIQLTPGTDTAHPLADNGTLPLRATSPVVDFDQILDTFDKPTRDSLTSLVRTAASAVQGQEGTLQQLIPDLRDLSVHSVTPTAELSTRNAEINNILINLGTTADTLNRSGSDLVGVIDSLNSITGALASHQAALEGEIANTDKINQTTNAVLSGGKASELNAGLQRLGSFATQLNSLMTDLVPETASFAGDTSKATGHFIWQDARNLIFQIGAATAQSDRSGFFLRQAANGADPCGLFGPSCTATTAPPSAGTTCLPLLPCLPIGGLPALPPLPRVPPAPSVPPVPTPPVPTLPVPTPTLPVGLGTTTAYDSATDLLALWGWL